MQRVQAAGHPGADVVGSGVSLAVTAGVTAIAARVTDTDVATGVTAREPRS